MDNKEINHISTIEIKAKCTNQEKIREILKLHNADFKGVDHQVDTYFKVNNGRLKLREGNIENYLIFYERENVEGPKQSKALFYKNDPSSNLKDLLTKSIGILTIVDKQREIYFIKNIKFHLDNVQNLGTFIEVEVRDTVGDVKKEKLLQQCNFYLELLGIKETDFLENSYSDQILNSL